MREGCDLGIRCKKEITALHLAAGCGDPAENLEVLIGAGADVNAPDVDGDTPLHWAAMAGHGKNAVVLCGNVCSDRDDGRQ